MLREVLPVYKREIRTYFSSPALYVAIALVLALIGYQFQEFLNLFVMLSAQKLQSQGQAPPLNVTRDFIGGLSSLIHVIMIFIVPMLTMRLISEEKRLGTFELLVTCPLHDWSIVLGKFLACVTVIFTVLVLCLVYPLVIDLISQGKLEEKSVAVTYVGMLLAFSAYVAFGLFASSLTENQMLAGFITFVGLLLSFVLGYTSLFEGVKIFGDRVDVNQVIHTLAIYNHSEDYSQGVINPLDIGYFLIVISFFLILTTKVLDSRRWRI